MFLFQVSIQALLKSSQPGQGRRLAEKLEIGQVRYWSCSVKEAKYATVQYVTDVLDSDLIACAWLRPFHKANYSRL